MSASPDQVASAYKWVRDELAAPLIPLPQIHNPAQGAIDSGLDWAVKSALEATGLMGLLEKVTGKPQALTAAAQSWQDQAKALRAVAAALRGGAQPLPQQWHGDASAAFGGYMGQVVEAIDSTAQDAESTATILAQAAAECQLAEDTVIGIIREAIEWIAMTIAAGIVADVLTLGLATVVDAVVADAEITVFIGRVERVSESLARKLEELMKLVKEMKEAEKAGATISKANEARKAISVIRTGGKSALRPGTYLNPYKSVGNFAGKLALSPIKGVLAEPIVSTVTGLTGDPSGVLTGAANSNTNIDAVNRAADGSPAAPYHVPKSRIEQEFG
ncbi:hypothetical protein GCM10009665_39170 [Kitasatospora nipponensis]|uniref:Type VII secretion system (Wss) protein ESAT-6 n=1 Tax=Kitasatospora nipponensis TaxID=258049 RepID=A0ABP4H4G7_9ACTN